MGKLSKIKKSIAKNSKDTLNNALYTVEHWVENGNHCFKCTDCNGNVNYAFTLGEAITNGEAKSDFMRGFGDMSVILTFNESIRDKYFCLSKEDQNAFIWYCGIYHNELLKGENTPEDIKERYDYMVKTISKNCPALVEWFQAFTKTFVDMGNSVGWAPVSMNLATNIA